MRVVGRKILEKFASKHADARSQLRAWYYEAESVDWNKPKDIKDRYPKASFVRGNKVIFNITDNYRLIVRVAYGVKVVKIEKIGTHDEYNRWKF